MPLKSFSAAANSISAWFTERRTEASVCAWLTSGSTAATSCPLRTTSPSRTGSSTSWPESADLTSTLMPGSTVPTSSTSIWTSAASTLATGTLSFVLPSPLVRRVASATVAPTTATATTTTTQMCVRLIGVLRTC